MNLRKVKLNSFSEEKTLELYTAVVITKGDGSYRVDSGTYEFAGPSILFVSPFQTFQILEGHSIAAQVLQFHGDFYCIEFHKPEVACNGLLFNNVYLSPTLQIEKSDFSNVQQILSNIESEVGAEPPDNSVLISYLQLFLALSSRIKKRNPEQLSGVEERDTEMEKFKDLIEKNFLKERSPSQYAEKLGLSPNVLSKRCKRYFAKAPSELIQERVILEAKKRLHLTRKSVKEVSFELNFEDEHYFSRFFKKNVGVSPQLFREKAGISIVADLST